MNKVLSQLAFDETSFKSAEKKFYQIDQFGNIIPILINQVK
jgi:hypothetical protein